jgi:hypothetical protein
VFGRLGQPRDSQLILEFHTFSLLVGWVRLTGHCAPHAKKALNQADERSSNRASLLNLAEFAPQSRGPTPRPLPGPLPPSHFFPLLSLSSPSLSIFPDYTSHRPPPTDACRRRPRIVKPRLLAPPPRDLAAGKWGCWSMGSSESSAPFLDAELPASRRCPSLTTPATASSSTG